MGKTALITGITGQDGYYLSQWLLSQGYRVVGVVPEQRRSHLNKLGDLVERLEFFPVALTDPTGLMAVVEEVQPQEIYNLAAPSFIPDSWHDPLGTLDLVTGTATRLLDAVRKTGLDSRFYQASSSEMFGDVATAPQDESTPFRPKNPYAAAKAHAHWTMVHHRQRYDLFACSGILYNHESPRRPPNFVVRKVTQGVAAIKLGLSDRLLIGNLTAKRDWGYAQDYVQAMWRMLQTDQPEDYVIGTGQLHSVQELVETAFALVDLDWQKYTEVVPDLIRSDDHFQLVANPHKAKTQLGWQPQVSFTQLIENMVKADLALLQANIP
jgi:GDPmannose 4,6-dehydratase